MKSGDRADIINYRPISKLYALPKLFEKLLELRLPSMVNCVMIDEQIMVYVKVNRLIPI